MFEKAHFNAERQEMRRNLVEMDTIYKKKKGLRKVSCSIPVISAPSTETEE